MSSGGYSWRPLPLAPSSCLPNLLVSVETGASSYVVRVTDMADMWVESLERKEICMRGWAENTSIDPSDTPENMAKFLAILTSALDPLHPGHGDTSVGLAPATSADAGKDGLTLRVTCALPGLTPLEWPIHLSKSPSSAVAAHLVLPLIQAHYARKREVDFLLRALGQKDSVIAKLSDKLEAMGTGLEYVFASLSGKKKVTRSAADGKVKGLAPFDQHDWRADAFRDMDGPDQLGDLLQDVFGDSGLRCRNLVDIDDSHVPDSWWRDLKDGHRAVHRERTRPAPSSTEATPPPAGPQAADENDDEFQVQATPPGLRSLSAKGKGAGNEPPASVGSSTTDGDQEESLIPDSHPPAPAPALFVGQAEPKTAPPSRLGAIGGQRPSATSRTSLSEGRIPGLARAGPPADDSETASETSDDDATASVQGSSPSPPPAAKPAVTGIRKGGLGSIGGGAQKRNAGEGGGRCLDAEAPTAMGDSATHKKSLGVIGNRVGGQASSCKPTQEESGRGRKTEWAAAVDVPRESSRERADRRRAELKRDLERKAAASPVKKKRRF